MERARWAFIGIVVGVVSMGVVVSVMLDNEHWRQLPLACTPNVDGLKRNGKEIPLTSAQRDSLAKGYPNVARRR